MGDKQPINGVVCGGMVCDHNPNKENEHEVKEFFNEFPKTYDKIKDLDNELDGYAILHYLNSLEIDETSAKHLESLRELSRQMVNVAHELAEHLAWD